MTDRRQAVGDPLENDLPIVDNRLRNDQLPGQTAPPLPPLQVIVEATSSGVRITVVNDGPLGVRLNGAVRYDAYWAAAPVDTTTAAGKAAGFARAVCQAPSIPATDVDHTQSSALFSDPKYAAGFWYVCGVGSDGTRSAPSEPASVITGPVDTTIPGEVQHLQISESGRVANRTVFSELSVTAMPPDDTSNFGGVQLYLKDYSALDEIQEGFAHPWTGSGAIDFDVLYDVPRRGGKFAINAANGSITVTAAAGFLSVAQIGDQLELMSNRLDIVNVTDTAITLATPWPLASVNTSDWSIIARVTISVVSIGKSGSRRADVTGAPSVKVLMDGNISVPNSPAHVYITNSGVSVLIEWDQVAGSTIDGYDVYRSPGSTADTGMLLTPPVPSAGTILLDRVLQNSNLPEGSTYVRMQSTDDRFTPYDLEVNSAFVWYVTTTNTRGDQSGASFTTGNCQRQVTNEIDPTQTGRNPGKNYLYNAALAGTVGNSVSANDNSQDSFMGTDASNLPGRPYGAASGQANGTGKFRGYTRFEATDSGTGAAGGVTFQNGDEVHITAPGAAKKWSVYAEIGAWNEGSGTAFQKLAKGEVYTISLYLNHDGVTAVDGQFSVYVEQSSNGTVQGNAKRRFRDSGSVITDSSTPLLIATASIVATSTRFQASFQLDSTLTTKQVRIRFEWLGGTSGVVVIRRVMDNAGEAAAQWTADMGDPSISMPTPAVPIDPIGDGGTGRDGDGWFDKRV
jgi:hypothetical protein